MPSAMRIGVLGATGPAGRSLAARLADVGHDVLVGSREQERADEIVGRLADQWGDRVASVQGVENAAAGAEGEIVVIAVPWEAAPKVAASLRDELSGKIIVSMANALRKVGDGFEAVVPNHGSVAHAVADAAPEARVVAALHHVAAKELGSLDHAVDGDVLVCSDDRDAAGTVGEVIAGIPRLEPIDVGGLHNAVGMEAFTAVMLSVNVRHKVRTGLRLTGLPR